MLDSLLIEMIRSVDLSHRYSTDSAARDGFLTKWLVPFDVPYGCVLVEWSDG